MKFPSVNLASTPYRLGWLASAGTALALSAYSLYYVGVTWGIIPVLAAMLSVCFDGAAIVSADMALRRSRTPNTPSIGARLLTLVFAGMSAYINAQHGVLLHLPLGACLVFAAPPLVAVALFDQHLKYEHAQTIKRPARFSVGWQSWLMFPLRSRRITWNHYGEALDKLEGKPSTMVDLDPAKVRLWAAEQGLMDAKSYGRIPKAVNEKYIAAFMLDGKEVAR